jgi:two-component system NtrC family sensor kinase
VRDGGLDSADAYPSAHDLLPRLASRAAHDLNNLIAVLSGHLYLLRAAGSRAGGADGESLSAMQTAIAGLEALSRSLSAVGAAHGPFARLDINAAVREAAGTADIAAPELDLADGLPPVSGSPDGLRAILRALLANAAAAEPGARPRVATRREGDAVLVLVEDSGPGISKDAGGRVFEPFFSTRGGGRGTGIGLFVAAAVASAHGTSIRLDERPGGGTVASIRLKTA